MSTIRILLADEHPVVREGLRVLVGTQSNMEVVGEATDGPSAIALTAELDPNVVVIDVYMPGLDGAQVMTRLRATRPDRKVLVLTAREGRGDLRLLFEAGASGCVPKRAAAAELVRAIRTVADGGAYIDPTLVASGAEEFVPAAGAAAAIELSEREAEVMRLIALGYSNKEIAARLKVSVKTVETYKARSMEKLRIRSRVEIVRYALGRGWLNNP